jgi:hypothetical protein
MIFSVSEPTIDELLNDDITSSLMWADRVDVSVLLHMLHGVASWIGTPATFESDVVAATPYEIAKTINTEGLRPGPRGERLGVGFFN